MSETKWDYTTGWETTEVCEQCGRTFRLIVNVPGAGMDGCAGWVAGRSLCTECAPKPYPDQRDVGDENRPATYQELTENVARLEAELAQARADLARVTGERDEVFAIVEASQHEQVEAIKSMTAALLQAKAARAEAAALAEALEAAMSWFPADVSKTGWPEILAAYRASASQE